MARFLLEKSITAVVLAAGNGQDKRRRLKRASPRACNGSYAAERQCEGPRRRARLLPELPL